MFLTSFQLHLHNLTHFNNKIHTIMKEGIVLLMVYLFSTFTTLHAQQQGWFINKTEAHAYALEHKVPVLYVFAGSDWCKPCIQLKQTILLSDTFKAYYPTRMAILYLDFPQQKKNELSPELKKQNDALAAQYNKSGYFPYLVVVDSSGKAIGNLYFKHQTSVEFIQQFETIQPN